MASFYTLFALSERPPVIAHVCDDIACKTRGADVLCAELEGRLGPPGGTGGLGLPAAATWMRSPCLGLCEQAPAAMLVAAGAEPFERSWGDVSPDSVVRALVRKRVADPATPRRDRPHPPPLPDRGQTVRAGRRGPPRSRRAGHTERLPGGASLASRPDRIVRVRLERGRTREQRPSTTRCAPGSITGHILLSRSVKSLMRHPPRT